jgi:hypothetical protein
MSYLKNLLVNLLKDGELFSGQVSIKIQNQEYPLNENGILSYPCIDHGNTVHKLKQTVVMVFLGFKPVDTS